MNFNRNNFKNNSFSRIFPSKIISRLGLILCLLLVQSLISRGEKIIINVDAGGDDAIAILTFLRYEAFEKTSKFEVIGITCSYGNVVEDQVELNVLKTLEIAGRLDIPVYGGAKKGIIEKFSTDNVYGQDGFGNLNVTQEDLPVDIDRSEFAAVALVKLAKENSGNVSIISLGPTTNLALAIALDNNFMSHVKHVYQMGGSVQGRGNKYPNVEFNFAADPESNFILFNSSAEAQITLFPWENSLDTVVTKDWRRNVLGKYESPYINFLNKVERVALNRKKRTIWIVADALAVASIIEPSIILSQEKVNVYPVIDGAARGSILVDYSKKTDRIANAFVVLKNNATEFQEVMIRYLTCVEIPC